MKLIIFRFKKHTTNLVDPPPNSCWPCRIWSSHSLEYWNFRQAKILTQEKIFLLCLWKNTQNPSQAIRKLQSWKYVNPYFIENTLSPASILMKTFKSTLSREIRPFSSDLRLTLHCLAAPCPVLGAVSSSRSSLSSSSAGSCPSSWSWVSPGSWNATHLVPVLYTPDSDLAYFLGLCSWLAKSSPFSELSASEATEEDRQPSSMEPSDWNCTD